MCTTRGERISDNILKLILNNLINLYHLVIKLEAINNDGTTTKEWTAAEATGGLNELWRQIFALDSDGFLLKHKRVKLE